MSRALQASIEATVSALLYSSGKRAECLSITAASMLNTFSMQLCVPWPNECCTQAAQLLICLSVHKVLTFTGIQSYE